MDEEQYFTAEENIPLSSPSWIWKKRNSVSPGAKSQIKTEEWMQTVLPSIYQGPKDAGGCDAKPISQATIHSFVPLPGSVINYSHEIPEHPSCVIKSAVSKEEPDQDGEKDSWLHRLGMNTHKWSFLNSLIGWNEDRDIEKDHPNTSGVCSTENNEVTELEECWRKEELPYIPYKLAKLYVTKIVEDMQQMKSKYMTVIKELDSIRKENQEQAITNMKKHYGDKMRSLKDQLEAYQKLTSKRSMYCQDIIKNLKERNRQLSQEKEELLHQINQQSEKWEEEKTWILEKLSKNLDHLYTEHALTLQELQDISLCVDDVLDLVNFQIKVLQKKLEKTEKGKGDVSVVSEPEVEQVADEKVKPECLVEKGYLCQVQTILQKVQESLDKREKEVTELLQNERRYNKAMKPQITVLIFLKTLVNRVHNIYCDVSEARQYISQRIRKNENERADWKEAFNNAQADILSYEVFSGNEPVDDKRTQRLTNFFRNLGRAKSELENVETEKIVFDCIQTGEIPDWIKRDCLCVALTESGKDTCSEKTSHLPEKVIKKIKSQITVANEPKKE